MKNILLKIPRLKGRQRQRSYIKNDGLKKGNNSGFAMLSTYTGDDKPDILDSSNNPEKNTNSDESNGNEEKLKINAQHDLRRDDSIFLIENYAELLVQKLRPLNSHCTRLLDRYSFDDVNSHSN
ncbi:hypothetical protein [Candidatus Nitrosocosmicus hydrocola]|uniref:hypothetical protein n=1 Tax=Candidatus Nitrosocosmicus hydrocola TaxID=1826872 RepID=UPI0011E5B0DB|nr:hypothetical protein [Candidatus Nitrosocosmicus hydrocola]